MILEVFDIKIPRFGDPVGGDTDASCVLGMKWVLGHGREVNRKVASCFAIIVNSL